MSVYNWKPAYLDTFIPDLPKLLNDNFQATETYIGVFYDPSKGVIISPISTPGNIRGARLEGVTGVFDTLVVRNQYTNLYENVTTIDSDFYNSYTGADTSTRAADSSTLDSSLFTYIDLQTAYVKIVNDASIAITTSQLGQEFQIIWDPSYNIENSPFRIMLDPCTASGNIEVLDVTVQDSSATWIKLISVDYDTSWGTTWTLKQFGGTFTRTEI